MDDFVKILLTNVSVVVSSVVLSVVEITHWFELESYTKPSEQQASPIQLPKLEFDVLLAHGSVVSVTVDVGAFAGLKYQYILHNSLDLLIQLKKLFSK